MREVVICAAARSAVGKSGRGSLKDTRPDELLGQVLSGVLAKVPTLDPAKIDDVVIGTAADRETQVRRAIERDGATEAEARQRIAAQLPIEDKVARAEVIDVSKLSGKVIKFGAKVTLADEDSDEEITYQIVGTEEADIDKHRLSITSPLARALIGKQTGDSVEVMTPRGSKAYEIMKVRYR